jgi:hypothetical protein
MHEPGDVTEATRADEAEGDYVEFWPAGIAATGWFRCAACGNQVNVRQVVPRCMLCGERLWERAVVSQGAVVPRPF